MEIKTYLFLLVILSTATIIYSTLGSNYQNDQEIHISNEILKLNNINSDYFSIPTIRECPYCNGTGLIECPQCKGSGKIITSTYCKYCEGTGKIYQNHTIINCPYCNNGTIETSTVCDACNGTGYIKCPVCGGTGIIKS
jgi:DnaJ-class molecular chaperone